MSIVEFRDPSGSDDYLAWTGTHWNGGYVINIQRGLNPSDARLHHAWCRTVNGVPPRGNGFIGPYIKICSDSIAELRDWTAVHVGAEIPPCGSCRPLNSPAEHAASLRSANGKVIASAKGAEPRAAAPMALVAERELDRLVDACRPLPVRTWVYEQPDYMTNVLLTVLDLQMHNSTVERSIRHYWNRRQEEISELDQLAELLARFTDDQAGNTEVAQHLWGNNHWVRVRWLRGFVRFLVDEDLRTQESLVNWARRSDFERDFKGRAKYLGPAAYRWLLMRLGVDTVKPDVHLRRFAERIVGHAVSDTELIRAVTETARRLGESARELDAAIWEHERGEPVPSDRLIALPASCRTLLAQRRIDGGELIDSAAGGELLEVLALVSEHFEQRLLRPVFGVDDWHAQQLDAVCRPDTGWRPEDPADVDPLVPRGRGPRELDGLFLEELDQE